MFTLVVPQAQRLERPISANHAYNLTSDYFKMVIKPDLYSPHSIVTKKRLAVQNEFVKQSEAAILTVINQHRVQNELSEVVCLEELNRAARIRSQEMFTNNYFEHRRPDKNRWYTVLTKDVGFEYLSAGENIAVMYTEIEYPNQPFSANRWYRIWENSPTHYATMMDPDFDYVGIGVYHGIKDGKYYSYATTIFAKL